MRTYGPVGGGGGRVALGDKATSDSSGDEAANDSSGDEASNHRVLHAAALDKRKLSSSR